MFKNFLKFSVGMLILLCFYFISLLIIHILKINFPPAILGLMLFAAAMIKGLIKEEWIKPACDWLLNNIAMFLLPFMGGLVAYQALIIKNLIPIILVIFITTTLMIVLTGLFIEYGLAFIKLHHWRKNNHD